MLWLWCHLTQLQGAPVTWGTVEGTPERSQLLDIHREIFLGGCSYQEPNWRSQEVSLKNCHPGYCIYYFDPKDTHIHMHTRTYMHMHIQTHISTCRHTYINTHLRFSQWNFLFITHSEIIPFKFSIQFQLSCHVHFLSITSQDSSTPLWKSGESLRVA